MNTQEQKKQEVIKIALIELTKWCLSGGRYERRNPYCIPEIAGALKALGYKNITSHNLFTEEE